MKHIYSVAIAILLAFPVQTSAFAQDCTLQQVRSLFDAMYRISQNYDAEMGRYLARGETLPDGLEAKYDKLSAGSQELGEHLYAKEHGHPDLPPETTVAQAICIKAVKLINANAPASYHRDIPDTTQAALSPSFTPPPCEKDTLLRRFGELTRLQRKLRISGKIDHKKRAACTTMVNDFRNAYREIPQNGPDEACIHLAGYEELLTSILQPAPATPPSPPIEKKTEQQPSEPGRPERSEKPETHAASSN